MPSASSPEIKNNLEGTFPSFFVEDNATRNHPAGAGLATHIRKVLEIPYKYFVLSTLRVYSLRVSSS